MRPDEHKKKKSRQYQKKHGNEQLSKTGGGSRKSEKGVKKPVEPASSKSAIQIKSAPNENTSSTSDTDQEEQTRQQFRRRQIDSNWSRYEGVDDTREMTDESRKTADFQRLLNKVVTAESQLKLSDEKDWEDLPAGTGDTGLDLLAIDCGELSRILKTVPLPARYGVEDEAEQAGFLTMYEEQSKKACDRLLSNVNMTKPTRPDTSSDIEMRLNVKTTPEKLAQKTDILDNLSEISKGIKCASTLNPQEYIDVTINEQTEPTEEEKYSRLFWTGEEAENIDNSDNPANNCEIPVKLVRHCDIPVDNADKDEEDLNFLLSLDKSKKASQTIPQQEQHSTSYKDIISNKIDQGRTSAATSEKENVADLEDWLDSVLDD